MNQYENYKFEEEKTEEIPPMFLCLIVVVVFVIFIILDINQSFGNIPWWVHSIFVFLTGVTFIIGLACFENEAYYYFNYNIEGELLMIEHFDRIEVRSVVGKTEESLRSFKYKEIADKIDAIEDAIKFRDKYYTENYKKPIILE